MNSWTELIVLFQQLRDIEDNMEYYKDDMDKWMKLYWDYIQTEAKLKSHPMNRSW